MLMRLCALPMWLAELECLRECSGYIETSCNYGLATVSMGQKSRLTPEYIRDLNLPNMI
jgi:hypothetical protein